MNKFIWGFVIGGIVAFLLGVNVGKEKPLLSNPFADRPVDVPEKSAAERLAEEAKDKAGAVAEKAKDKMKEIVEQTKQAVHEATRPAEEAEPKATQPGD